MSFFIKRAIDVMVAGTGLLVLAPVLAAVAVAVRLSMGRPGAVPPCPARIPGQALRPVQIPQHAGGPRARRRAARSDDERLTPLGRFLRCEPRRATPALERAQGRPEPRRPPAAAAAVPAALHPRAGPPPRRPAGDHRLGPGQRAERNRLGREVEATTSGTWTTGRCGWT